MKKIFVALILAVSVFGASIAQANLIVNGGFESPDIAGPWQNFPGPGGIDGWTAHNVDLVDIIYYNPSTGNQSLDLNGFGAGFIRQDIPTTAEQTYYLIYYLAGNPLGSGPAEKLYDVDTSAELDVDSSFDTTGFSPTNMGWTRVTHTFTALSDITTITFHGGNIGTGGAALDDVSVTPVPEPGTMMLLGAGFLGLAIYGKRRKNA